MYRLIWKKEGMLDDQINRVASTLPTENKLKKTALGIH